jgi:hypothetical protein
MLLTKPLCVMREDAVSAYSRTHEKHALKEAGGDLLDGGEATVSTLLELVDERH